MEKVKCLNCGKVVKQIPHKRKKQYCDSTCRSNHWQKTVLKDRRRAAKEAKLAAKSGNEQIPAAIPEQPAGKPGKAAQPKIKKPAKVVAVTPGGEIVTVRPLSPYMQQRQKSKQGKKP